MERSIILSKFILAITLCVIFLTQGPHHALCIAKPTPPQPYPGAESFFRHVPTLKEPIKPDLNSAQFGDSPQTTYDGCILNFTTSGMKVCDMYGDFFARKTIILAGGSHAEHWFTALNILSHKLHFHLVTILRMGCVLSTNPRPLMPNHRDPYPYCKEWQAAAIKEIIRRKPDYLFTTVTRPYPRGYGDYVPNFYIGAFKKFRAAGIKILGMRDTPWPRHAPFKCLQTAGGTPYTCGAVLSASLRSVNPAINALANFPNIKLIDMSSGLCNFRRNYCPAVVGNLLVWHDYHHLGRLFVSTMAPELGLKITRITHWRQ